MFLECPSEKNSEELSVLHAIPFGLHEMAESSFRPRYGSKLFFRTENNELVTTFSKGQIGGPAFLAHTKQKVSNIVGLTAFFMRYEKHKVVQWL